MVNSHLIDIKSVANYKIEFQIYRRVQYFKHPIKKHFNDLLDTHRSEWSWAEVTYFYVGYVFCIHLGSKYSMYVQAKVALVVFQEYFIRY